MRVIIFVQLLSVLCGYGAVSVMWPFAYNPYLNENLVEGIDDSFGQQDGTPLLTKKWAASHFGTESFVTVVGSTAAGEHMFHADVLRDMARIEKRTLETHLIPLRNFGFKQYSLNGSLGFTDFCARACPKSEGCGCKSFSIFALLKPSHDELCNDAKNAAYDLAACYDLLDEYASNATAEGPIVSKLVELAAAHEAGPSSCHGGMDFEAALTARLAQLLPTASSPAEAAAMPAAASAELTASFLACSAMQARNPCANHHAQPPCVTDHA